MPVMLEVLVITWKNKETSKINLNNILFNTVYTAYYISCNPYKND